MWPAKLGYVHINTLALLGLVADALREIILFLRRVTLSQHSFFLNFFEPTPRALSTEFLSVLNHFLFGFRTEQWGMPAGVCWEISEILETAPSIYMDIDTPQHNKSLHLARKYKFCFVNDTENENQHVQFKRFHSKESLASLHVYCVYPSRDR